MGNESSNTNTNTNDNTNTTENCNHGYEGPSYNHLNNDSLESIHLKNDYNDATDRTLSFEPQSPATIIQDMVTIHNAPSNISDACNNCKD
jgi:hypothetical protein